MKVFEHEIKKGMTVEIQSINNKICWFALVTSVKEHEFTVSPERPSGWPERIVFDGELSTFEAYRITRIIQSVWSAQSSRSVEEEN